MTVAASAQDLAAGEESPGSWRDYRVDLARLAKPQGTVLEGVQDAVDLFFPVPQDIAVESALVDIQVEFSTALSALANITASVNGSPRQVLQRAATNPYGHAAVQIPLTGDDLKRRFVHLRLDAALLMSDDRCLNYVMQGAFARVLPVTGVQYVLADTPPSTIEGSWSLLPQEVSIGLEGGKLDPGQFKAALAIATELRRRGHRVRITDLSELSPIIIARPHALAALERFSLRHADGSPFTSQDPHNLELLVAGAADDRPVIWLPSRQASEPAGLLAGPWRLLARRPALAVTRADPWRSADDPDDGVHFSELGLVEPAREVNDRTTWRLSLDQQQMGPQRVPGEVELLMVTAPSRTKGEALVHVTYNDRLLRSTALDNRGGIQRVSVNLPASLLRARNRLEVSVQRQTQDGQCRLEVPAFPVQLLPESRILTDEAKEDIETFADVLPGAQNAQLFLPASALHSPQKVIPFLLAMGGTFWPTGPLPEVTFYEPDEDVEPNRDFVLVGEPEDPPEGPVEFDRGDIQIRTTRSNNVVLDVASGADWNILQVADWGRQRGLWLKSRKDFADLPTDELFIEDEDIAFLNARGVAFAMRSSPHEAVHIAYEGSSWIRGVLERHRLIFFALTWVLLAGLIIYMLRMSRRHSGETHGRDRTG